MGLKLITFDTETTGVDVENDRIITCFMRVKDGEEVVFEQNWVIDPGVEVPEGASDVHGMTTEWVQENGRKDVAEAISEISNYLHSYGSHPDGDNHIITGYNSSFDLAILNAESKRHLDGDELVFDYGRFLDPLVIDRHIDKFRKGGRKLVDVATHYGVKVEEDKLHAADYDVYLTEQLVPKVLNAAWKKLSRERQGLTPDEFIDKLQTWQAEWKKDWAEGITAYFKKSGKTEEDGSPIIVEGKFPW